uniref:Uncharacterized protein n=1 Tax=Tetradesmus obliquus TaxID=3088 RepID=A0A383V7Y2_TETOB|eukprot:jgi/Sobl393_1/6882/SZX61698.1
MYSALARGPPGKAHHPPSKQAYSSTMWVLALLAISSSWLASPAAAQLGAYSFSELPGAYSLGEPGAYTLTERAMPGAYSLAERAQPGAYSFSDPGAYSLAEPGGYSFGADIPMITLDDLANLLPEPQLRAQQRNLLAVSEITVPASIPASGGDVPASSNDNLELDIVPAELPASRSWDSQNWQSWEEWYSQHFNSHPDVAGAGAYGMSVAGDYGQGSYGYGSYGSSYGSEGAYFDFRSNRAFVPEQAVNTAAPDSSLLPAGTLVHMPSSASGAGARLAEQQLQMDPATPTLSVSRGRGLSLGVSGGQESAAAAAAAAAGSTGFTGQVNLAALNLQAPEQQTGPARRLLAKAADALSALAGPLRLSEAAAAPGNFARRLLMARSS